MELCQLGQPSSKHRKVCTDISVYSSSWNRAMSLAMQVLIVNQVHVQYHAAISLTIMRLPERMSQTCGNGVGPICQRSGLPCGYCRELERMNVAACT